MLQVSHAATKTPRGEQPVLGSPQHAQYHKWRGTCVLSVGNFCIWVTIRKRNIGTVAALGGLTAAVALITALPSARADELGDLRANQELLQRRIDQLAQLPPPGAPPGGPGGPV